MALYEHIYIARQDVSRSHVEELTKNITEMVEKQGERLQRPNIGVCASWLTESTKTVRGIIHCCS